MEGDFIWPHVLLSRANIPAAYSDDDAQSASSSPRLLLPPVGLGRGAQAKADQGSRLSEPKASSSETPLLSSTAGLSYWGQTPISLRCFAPHPQGEPKAWRIGALTPITPRPSGRLFFGLLFFWRRKRQVSCRRATPGLQANPSRSFTPRPARSQVQEQALN